MLPGQIFKASFKIDIFSKGINYQYQRRIKFKIKQESTIFPRHLPISFQNRKPIHLNSLKPNIISRKLKILQNKSRSKFHKNYVVQVKAAYREKNFKMKISCSFLYLLKGAFISIQKTERTSSFNYFSILFSFSSPHLLFIHQKKNIVNLTREEKKYFFPLTHCSKKKLFKKSEQKNEL